MTIKILIHLKKNKASTEKIVLRKENIMELWITITVVRSLCKTIRSS